MKEPAQGDPAAPEPRKRDKAKSLGSFVYEMQLEFASESEGPLASVMERAVKDGEGGPLNQQLLQLRARLLREVTRLYNRAADSSAHAIAHEALEASKLALSVRKSALLLVDQQRGRVDAALMTDRKRQHIGEVWTIQRGCKGYALTKGTHVRVDAVSDLDRAVWGEQVLVSFCVQDGPRAGATLAMYANSIDLLGNEVLKVHSGTGLSSNVLVIARGVI